MALITVEAPWADPIGPTQSSSIKGLGAASTPLQISLAIHQWLDRDHREVVEGLRQLIKQAPRELRQFEQLYVRADRPRLQWRCVEDRGEEHPGRRQLLAGADLAEGGGEDEGRKYRVSPFGLVYLQPGPASQYGCEAYVSLARSIGPQLKHLLGSKFPPDCSLSATSWSQLQFPPEQQPREWVDPESALAAPRNGKRLLLELAQPGKRAGYEGRYVVQPVLQLTVASGFAGEAVPRYFWTGPEQLQTTVEHVTGGADTGKSLWREGPSGYERVPEEEPLAALAEAGTLRVAEPLRVRVRTARGIVNMELPLGMRAAEAAAMLRDKPVDGAQLGLVALHDLAGKGPTLIGPDIKLDTLNTDGAVLEPAPIREARVHPRLPDPPQEAQVCWVLPTSHERFADLVLGPYKLRAEQHTRQSGLVLALFDGPTWTPLSAGGETKPRQWPEEIIVALAARVRWELDDPLADHAEAPRSDLWPADIPIQEQTRARFTETLRQFGPRVTMGVFPQADKVRPVDAGQTVSDLLAQFGLVEGHLQLRLAPGYELEWSVRAPRNPARLKRDFFEAKYSLAQIEKGLDAQGGLPAAISPVRRRWFCAPCTYLSPEQAEQRLAEADWLRRGDGTGSAPRVELRYVVDVPLREIDSERATRPLALGIDLDRQAQEYVQREGKTPTLRFFRRKDGIYEDAEFAPSEDDAAELVKSGLWLKQAQVVSVGPFAGGEERTFSFEAGRPVDQCLEAVFGLPPESVRHQVEAELLEVRRGGDQADMLTAGQLQHPIGHLRPAALRLARKLKVKLEGEPFASPQQRSLDADRPLYEAIADVVRREAYSLFGELARWGARWEKGRLDECRSLSDQGVTAGALLYIQELGHVTLWQFGAGENVVFEGYVPADATVEELLVAIGKGEGYGVVDLGPGAIERIMNGVPWVSPARKIRDIGPTGAALLALWKRQTISFG